MFVVSAFFMLLGCVNVSAATLVEGSIDDVYYTRRGGGKPYMSAQYHTYTMDGKTVYCIEPGINITVHDYNGHGIKYSIIWCFKTLTIYNDLNIPSSKELSVNT